MRILTNNENIIKQLKQQKPEYLAYATGAKFLEHLLSDNITDIYLKYQQKSIIDYIKQQKLKVMVYYPNNTKDIGNALDELSSLKVEQTKTPKYHRYL